MREILFRGKSIGDGQWQYGDLLNVGVDYDYAIRTYGGREHGQVNAVNGNTVGQYTGLTDKNGKKIFEGDIVRLYLVDGCEEGVIKFNGIMCRFMFFTKEGSYSFDKDCVFEIIGNIHDNPELLKGGE